MPRLFLQSALGVAVLLVSPLACALGFGPSSTPTTLGQHLNFAASVMLDADETLSRDCVFADVYAGDAKVAPRNVRAVLEATRDASQRIVRVTTAVVIDEPIVTIEVSVGCGSRISRRFVTFIDPPSLQLAESGVTETMPLPAQGVDAQSASLADIARQADASRRPSESRAPEGGREGEPRIARRMPRGPHRVAVARSATSAPAKGQPVHVSARPNRGKTRTALAAPPRIQGARLRLEEPRLLAAAPAASAASSAVAPATNLVAPYTLPTLPVDAAMAPATSPAAAASDATAEAQQRERIQSLEAGLASVRADAQATQQTIATLQARLRQAEGERYRNHLVYVLIGTTLLGILTAVGLWLLRPRQRRRARWFDAQASQQARASRVERRATPSAAPVSSIPAALHGDSGHDWSDHPANARSTRPATIGGLEVTTVLGPEFSRPTFEASTPGDVAAGPKKNADLTMEELIDLEQQAEFFVVLGQDEAAMSLLHGYMQGSGGKSPLPYLQLLEIHQRRGEQAAYDRVRKLFNERFNANAPDWNSALHLGRGLDAYPQTVARLQSLWSTPLSAMQALDNLLFRRQAAEETFDFPAYRELLFLYSIARELSGNVETDFGSIDLFLPLEGATAEALQEADGPSEDGIDTAAGRFSVDLDVSNWPEDATMSDLLMRRNPARRNAG